ncbi:MAG TPA: lipid-A-disaccharide synthase [Bacteroidaceae bacterium]|nr:lipid-A-disaccharide synthase [Bacteroidaceae bacterium]
MRYYLVAGEASGDLHASNLMSALLIDDSEADFRFLGGDLMSKIGGFRVHHFRDTAYMGIWPVLAHIQTIFKRGREIFRDIATWNPDVVILIDCPGFNLPIASLVRKKLSIPVVYYISPKIWAWKSYRIKRIRRDVTELFSILPFEPAYYKQRGFSVKYVGNPSLDAIEEFRNSSSSGRDYGDKPLLTLLPGSRKQEIKRNLSIMLKTVREIDGFQIVVAGAPSIEKEYYQSLLKDTDIKVFFEQTYELLEKSYVAIITSGTATLETALFGIPQVVCYYMPFGGVVSFLRKMFLKIKYISLVNIIAGREVVPELVAGKMTATNLKKELLPLLSDTEERAKQLKGYNDVRKLLGPTGASKNAARGIIRLLKEKR